MPSDSDRAAIIIDRIMEFSWTSFVGKEYSPDSPDYLIGLSLSPVDAEVLNSLADVESELLPSPAFTIPIFAWRSLAQLKDSRVFDRILDNFDFADRYGEHKWMNTMMDDLNKITLSFSSSAIIPLAARISEEDMGKSVALAIYQLFRLAIQIPVLKEKVETALIIQMKRLENPEVRSIVLPFAVSALLDLGLPLENAEIKALTESFNIADILDYFKSSKNGIDRCRTDLMFSLICFPPFKEEEQPKNKK